MEKLSFHIFLDFIGEVIFFLHTRRIESRKLQSVFNLLRLQQTALTLAIETMQNWRDNELMSH